jgi:CTP synthase (UTP-ammonia lyase)
VTNHLIVVGDFNPDNQSHLATNEAIRHCSDANGTPVEFSWMPTEMVAQKLNQIEAAGGIWIGPASPYKSMEGALAAIRLAREKKIPLLGTCGGFQHIILEYARNVLGFADAEHAETDPYASTLFISRLKCSLVGRTMTIRLEPDSMAARVYGTTTTREGYYCNFGVNPDYVSVFRSGKLRIVGSDEEGEVRLVELPDHPFFVGSLFLPQLKSTKEAPHPLICAFLKACTK